MVASLGLCQNRPRKESNPLTEHPSSEELAALFRGGLSASRASEVLRHLLLPCGPCTDSAATLLGLKPVAEDFYDEPVDRAFTTALRHARSLDRQKSEAKKLEVVLSKGGVEAVQRLPRKTGDVALLDALLARSWSLRHDDPARMVQFAELAVRHARGIDARVHGPHRVADLLCNALAELGNAYRVSDKLREAAETLREARESFELGTQVDLLEIRLVELEASLAADRRQFEIACLKLTKVYRFHRRHHNYHLAGRALIKKGLYIGYADKGRLEDAINLLRQGRALVDPERDPDVIYSAVHNELLYLVESGRVMEARRLRVERSRELSYGKGRLNQVKLRALEGRLDAAAGKYERAVATYREVKQGYAELGRGYEASITRLDLAAALLHLGNTADARHEAGEAVKMFLALGIEREAYMSVLLVREIFEMRRANPGLIQSIADYLRRAQLDPDTPYSPSGSLQLR